MEQQQEQGPATCPEPHEISYRNAWNFSVTNIQTYLHRISRTHELWTDCVGNKDLMHSKHRPFVTYDISSEHKYCLVELSPLWSLSRITLLLEAMYLINSRGFYKVILIDNALAFGMRVRIIMQCSHETFYKTLKYLNIWIPRTLMDNTLQVRVNRTERTFE